MASRPTRLSARCDHEAESGFWWGSRLAVARQYRRAAALGAALIQLAVSSAHARGCRRFLAHVQSQNALLFQRLHWRALEEVELHGRPHLRMEADLAFYPPFAAPEIGFHVALPRRACLTCLRRRPRRTGRELAGVAGARRQGGYLPRSPRGWAFRAPRCRVGDDCAAIPDGDGHLLFAIEGFMNEFVAGDPWFAGWCGVMVNISDVAAMGGRPLAVVDAVWSDGEEKAAPVLRGLARRRRTFGVPLVGGHTNIRTDRGQLVGRDPRPS